MGSREPSAVAAALFLVVALLASGCGSGFNSSSTTGTIVHRRSTSATPTPKPYPGVGPSAPISKVIVARRTRPSRGLIPGGESNGASGCPLREGRGEIGIYTDVPVPSCVRITGRQRLAIVNRTTAYRRSDGKPLVVRLGPYRARLLPQQAAVFGPVGRFLGPGIHGATIDGGEQVDVMVEPNDCAILRPEPGQPLCFRRERAGRLRRWQRTIARIGAPACHGSDLAIAAERHSSIGSGGTIYTRLHITNRSQRPCTVAGVPEVLGIDRDGKSIGEAEPVPHLRPGSRGGRLRVKLEDGGSATFLVAHYDGGGAGRCKFTSTRGLRVTIRGTGPRQFVGYPMEYCPEPGAGLRLRVGRIEANQSG